MVDLDLGYHSKNSAFQLRMPKRYGITQHLVVKNHSRPLNDGKISIQVSAREACFIMREPSKQAMLASFAFSIPEKIENQIQFSSHRYAFENSSAGNSLLQLLEIFGGLKLAGEFFSDPIWVLIGLRFCNLQVSGLQDAKELRSLTENLYDFAQDIPEMNAIPEKCYSLLAQRLHGTLNHRLTLDKELSYAEMAEICNHFCGQQIRKNDTKTNWKDISFKHHYEPYLNEFIENGVLLRGSRLQCDYCGHKPWILLDDLKNKSSCSACGSKIKIPNNFELTYWLNNVVRNAIRENSLQYVIRELYEQARFPSGMFDFLPSQNVFLEGSKDVFTDLDIVVFRGTDLIIGEVKSEPMGLKSKDICKLLEVAKYMLPQEVIIVTQCGHIDENMQDLLLNPTFRISFKNRSHRIFKNLE